MNQIHVVQFIEIHNNHEEFSQSIPQMLFVVTAVLCKDTDTTWLCLLPVAMVDNQATNYPEKYCVNNISEIETLGISFMNPTEQIFK